ncbi:MAG: FAD-binding protein [Arcobacter sp.]|nr:FAD-binding protein [Arcobacter sp.]|tara:strand:- start:17951 stop:18175 length:225 start_codon:yes stop_codon:yes gene_type:complete
MNTDYEELIPNKILFTIKDIDELGIIKSDMCKKLLYKREIEAVKIGSKNHISRTELIRYLQSNTIVTSDFELSA